MTYIADRDALAKALAEHGYSPVAPACICGWDWDVRADMAHVDTAEVGWTLQVEPARRTAYNRHLAESLPVVDATRLTDEFQENARDCRNGGVRGEQEDIHMLREALVWEQAAERVAALAKRGAGD